MNNLKFLEYDAQQRKKKKIRKTIIITAIVLVLAVVAFVVCFKVLGLGKSDGDTKKTTVESKSTTAAETTTVPETTTAKAITFAAADDYITSKSKTNLRDAPDINNSEVVIQLENGSYVHRIGISYETGWSKVEYNGDTLYCWTEYMVTKTDAESTTVATQAE